MLIIESFAELITFLVEGCAPDCDFRREYQDAVTHAVGTHGGTRAVAELLRKDARIIDHRTRCAEDNEDAVPTWNDYFMQWDVWAMDDVFPEEVQRDETDKAEKLAHARELIDDLAEEMRAEMPAKARR